MTDLRMLYADVECLSPNEKLFDALSAYSHILPGGQDIHSDFWNVIQWALRPGNKRLVGLNFEMYSNQELKLCVKLCILSKRFSKKIAAPSCSGYLYGLIWLDKVLGSRSFITLKNEDFYEAEKLQRTQALKGVLPNFRVLQSFANWVRKNFNLRIDYKIRKPESPRYGRDGSEQGRYEKLVPDEVVASLFSAFNMESIEKKDKFFLSAFIVQVVIGGRVNELATLPKDCLVSVDNGFAMKVFSEKNGYLGVRFFSQALLPVLKAALKFITKVTDEGRAIVERIRSTQSINWVEVVRYPDALKYFTEKFVNNWTLTNYLVNPDKVWSFSLRRYIDAIELVGRLGYEGARLELGVSESSMRKLVWRQKESSDGKYLIYDSTNRKKFIDPSVAAWKYILRKHPSAIGSDMMSREIGISMFKHLPVIREILDAGLLAQLKREIYPKPIYDEVIETQFLRTLRPVIVNKYGKSLLEPENALFVIPKSLFSKCSTKKYDYQLISDSMFSCWLRGQCQNSDSFFSKQNIKDPRTGKIARFRWHDIRHWLNTTLKKGGLSDLQVNLLLGRKEPSQARVYDHTSSRYRSIILKELQESVRGGMAVGAVANTYMRLKVEDVNIAEQYLVSATLFLNRMPHGACTMNLALNPCPHNLSCFTCGDGEPCNHLLIDPRDTKQKAEVIELRDSSIRTVKYIEAQGGDASRQHDHFTKVVKSANRILEKISEIQKGSDDDH